MYKILIHTDAYAGDFERELCAFVTGQIGECGVGKHHADVYVDTGNHVEWWDNNILREQADTDYSCYRPCSIHATPGWFNNGMGGHYRDVEENYKLAHEDCIKATIDYFTQHRIQVQDRLNRKDYTSGWSEEGCIRTLEGYDARISQSKEKLNKYPAYQSVAIFVKSIPPETVLDELKDRATSYANNYKRYDGTSIPFVITSFEVVSNA